VKKKKTTKNKALEAAQASYNATSDAYDAANRAREVAWEAYDATNRAKDAAWDAHVAASVAFQPEGPPKRLRTKKPKRLSKKVS